MAGSHKEEVTGGRVVGHVPSKLEPSQTNKKTIWNYAYVFRSFHSYTVSKLVRQATKKRLCKEVTGGRVGQTGDKIDIKKLIQSID